jgi:hypothetical protein
MLDHVHVWLYRSWLTSIFFMGTIGTTALAQEEAEIVANGGFEIGLSPPWGTQLDGEQGPVWVRHGESQSTAEVDRQTSMSGAASLHIVNPAKQEDSFGETGQWILLEAQKKYRLTLWARASNLASDHALLVAIDGPESTTPLIWLIPGTYDWTPFSEVFSLASNECELRIISLDAGEVWLDDLAIEPE